MLGERKLVGLWEEGAAAVSHFLQLRGVPLPKPSLMLHNIKNKHGFLQLETLEGERGPPSLWGAGLAKSPGRRTNPDLMPPPPDSRELSSSLASCRCSGRRRSQTDPSESSWKKTIQMLGAQLEEANRATREGTGQSWETWLKRFCSASS